MREFKYDVIVMIHAIRERPCLWDKTIENYKDRVERRVAWEEIFNILDNSYEGMTPEEKRMTGEHILNKWTNIRDTFVKSLKTKMGKSRRKYIYYDHLKFLTKIIPEQCTIEEEEEFANDSNEEISYMKEEIDTDLPETPETNEPVKKRSKRSDLNDTKSSNYCVIEATYSQKKKSKKNDSDGRESTPDSISDESNTAKKRSKRVSKDLKDLSHRKKKSIKDRIKYKEDNENNTNDFDFVEFDETDNPRVMNEDEAFFASLLPTVVRYSEDERLEFRIEVLAAMKKIKDKRKWSDDRID